MTALEKYTSLWLGGKESGLDIWRTKVRLADAAIEELRTELDAIFHEFTDDMDGDGWEATMEWLRRDYPHLALRWSEDA